MNSQQRDSTDLRLSQWQAALWLLLVLLIPLFVNLWVEQQFEASKVWLLRTLVWALAVVWLAGWLRGGPLRPLPIAVRTFTILLILVIILSTLFSPTPWFAVFGSLERAHGALTQLTYLLLFCCVATRINPDQSRLILAAMVLTAVPICLFGLAQAAGWQPLAVVSDARSLITTTLGRANFTGAYLALLLPLTLAAYLLASDRRWRIGYGSLAVLEIIVIALTQARAAWIAATAGLGVFLWLRLAPGWSRRGRRLTALGGIAVLSGVLDLILNRGIAAGGSIAARWTIWQASLRLLGPRMWLGYGADTLELHFPSVYPPQLVYYQGRGVVVDRAHNWLLDWSLNHGVVATILFAALVALILWAGWRHLSVPSGSQLSPTANPPLESLWLAAAMGAICAQLVGNLFLFDIAGTAVAFWILLAIVTATTATESPPVTQAARPLWVRRSVILIAVIGLVGAVWQSNARPLLADIHSWQGTRAVGQGNLAVAWTEYETAARYQPRRAAYHSAVALTAAHLGNFAQAERAMEEARRLRPTDPVIYTQLAAIYAREAITSPERVGRAYAAYEQAIGLAPTIALTYQQYADLALRSGDTALAQLNAQRAVDLDATDGRAFGILGWAHLRGGDLAAAQAAFAEAVRWRPNSADFYLGLALTHFRQDELDAARAAVGQSLALDPAYPPALTLQRQLQE